MHSDDGQVDHTSEFVTIPAGKKAELEQHQHTQNTTGEACYIIEVRLNTGHYMGMTRKFKIFLSLVFVVPR